MVLNCTEPFIITLPSSQYDLSNVERDIKHQIIIMCHLSKLVWLSFDVACCLNQLCYITFVETDHDFNSHSPLPLIQAGHLSIIGESMCTSPGKSVNRLTDGLDTTLTVLTGQ